MQYFKRLLFFITRLLMKPLYPLIRPRVVPSDLPASLNLDTERPVVYILPTYSWSDRLVLERVCAKHGMPVPQKIKGDLPAGEEAACLYLPVLTAAAHKEPAKKYHQLAGLIHAAIEQPEHGLQVVPVSIFWGRDPGSETSVFKVLFSDRERPSRIRKFLMMLVQGRNSFVNFGQPVQFNELVTDSTDAEVTSRKLSRVLRVHFRRQRSAALGPSLANRQHITDSVLKVSGVRDTVAEVVKESGESESKVKERAAKYVDEIAANYSSTTIRILDLFLSWVWRKIFSGVQVKHTDRLRSIANNNGVIYLPSHRSHLDYLLISHTLYAEGLVPPHIAAGINLNFWPVGGLLRRGGAFYLRRSFGGNKLYTAVFRAYIDVLLNRGNSIKLFPEGGRSRTGRLLQPKTGLMAMIVQSFLRHPEKPLVFVPVFVGYDKLMESGSYLKELQGASKKKESAGDLLKARQIFKSSYGSPYVSFGRPIVLSDALDSLQPGWRAELQAGNSEPDWLPSFVEAVANDNMRRINDAVVLNPVGIVASLLLASPQKALAEQELLQQIDMVLRLLKAAPYSADMVLPEGDAASILEQAARTAGLRRIKHEWGDVITVGGKQSVLLTYYRNAVMHTLALPALVARFFRHEEVVEEKQLIQECAKLYPFLQRELFLSFDAKQIDEQLKNVLKVFAELGIVKRQRQGIRKMVVRPSVKSPEYAVLTGLGRILRETLERYCVTSLLLAEQIDKPAIPRQEFEGYLRLMAERMAMLSGRHSPEYFDKALFKGYLNSLIDAGFVRSQRINDEQVIEVDGRLSELAERWVLLLGPDVQQSMLQLISRPEVQVANRGDVDSAEQDQNPEIESSAKVH